MTCGCSVATCRKTESKGRKGEKGPKKEAFEKGRKNSQLLRFRLGIFKGKKPTSRKKGKLRKNSAVSCCGYFRHIRFFGEIAVTAFLFPCFTSCTFDWSGRMKCARIRRRRRRRCSDKLRGKTSLNFSLAAPTQKRRGKATFFSSFSLAGGKITGIFSPSPPPSFSHSTSSSSPVRPAAHFLCAGGYIADFSSSPPLISSSSSPPSCLCQQRRSAEEGDRPAESREVLLSYSLALIPGMKITGFRPRTHCCSKSGVPSCYFLFYLFLILTQFTA